MHAPLQGFQNVLVYLATDANVYDTNTKSLLRMNGKIAFEIGRVNGT
jgi:hypothetical protein